MVLPPQLTPLSKILERDHPNKVLLLVGAGIPMGATGAPYASWFGLLEHGIDHLVQTSVFTDSHRDSLINSLRSAFTPFDLNFALRHAENVEVNLQTPNIDAFAEWLETVFRGFRPLKGRTETLDALRELQQAGVLLATTNYSGPRFSDSGLRW
ncbi:MAG: hypothetical protein HGB06_06470 [Chlorobaculum sp.]|jgi:hypothetical protein|nr:hypothetical protein [Chlorobaculum sp.]